MELFDDRKRWVSVSFKDIRGRKDAMKRLMVLIGDRERGKLLLPRKKAIPTLAEYAETYLAMHTTAKENTLAVKKRAIGVLAKYLGEYPLDKVTPFIIEKFRLERREKDGVQDSSINVDVQQLSHVFNTAVNAGIVDTNPCQKVKRLRVSQTKDRILSGDEISRILDMPESKDRLMILTALFTGMRLNEVLNLSWGDVDFNKGIIHVHQSKTGKAIEIPLSDYLRTALEAYRTHSDGVGCFESREVTKAVVVRYSEYFSRFFKEMGIHGFTFHSLRHTFVSLMQAECNVGAVTVQSMTGHASLGMLQKYSHTQMGNKRAAIDSLNSYVTGAGQKSVLSLAQ